jgi:hypothetical protein
MQAKHIQFVRDNQLRLCASTTGNRNLAYVNGTVIINPSDVASEFAQAATSFATLPLDMSLWHRRLGHIGVRNVQRMVTNDLVTGLHLNPFPQQHCSLSTAPLQLIHSDVHEVKVPTASGLKYWVTFIDDYSRHYTVIPQEVQCFLCFQVFQGLC